MATEKITRSTHNGTQTIYRFDNGYGASIVKHSFSYGSEMAVVKFKGSSIDDFNLCYDTPITSDVLGYLTPIDVDNYLNQIEKLPSGT
jgi:hypothetical protein